MVSYNMIRSIKFCSMKIVTLMFKRKKSNKFNNNQLKRFGKIWLNLKVFKIQN